MYNGYVELIKKSLDLSFRRNLITYTDYVDTVDFIENLLEEKNRLEFLVDTYEEEINGIKN